MKCFNFLPFGNIPARPASHPITRPKYLMGGSIFDPLNRLNIAQNWSIFRQFALEGLGPNLPQNHRHFKDISQLGARPFCVMEFAGDGKQNCFFAKKMWPRRRQN
jgi:hypothetical protein